MKLSHIKQLFEEANDFDWDDFQDAFETYFSDENLQVDYTLGHENTFIELAKFKSESALVGGSSALLTFNDHYAKFDETLLKRVHEFIFEYLGIQNPNDSNSNWGLLNIFKSFVFYDGADFSSQVKWENYRPYGATCYFFDHESDSPSFVYLRDFKLVSGLTFKNQGTNTVLCLSGGNFSQLEISDDCKPFYAIFPEHECVLPHGIPTKVIGFSEDTVSFRPWEGWYFGEMTVTLNTTRPLSSTSFHNMMQFLEHADGDIQIFCENHNVFSARQFVQLISLMQRKEGVTFDWLEDDIFDQILDDVDRKIPINEELIDIQEHLYTLMEDGATTDELVEYLEEEYPHAF